MTMEEQRIIDARSHEKPWKKWGPYLAERQWGTVREDYSPYGTAWEYLTHDQARSKTYRWGEDGIAGISDEKQILCFAIALWNKKDPILKERFFGVTGTEGNHGEDVKEYYYYLDSTPTHSYMKMLYKYPLEAFPYGQLVEENRRRTKLEPEFELADTKIFDNDNYLDVFVEYAKNTPEDILIRVTIHNRSGQKASVNLLPQIWFRNTWAWGYDSYKPRLHAENHAIHVTHAELGAMTLFSKEKGELLFCENETNYSKLYNMPPGSGYYKDAFHEYLIGNNRKAVNPDKEGTKAGINYDISVEAQNSVTVLLRLGPSRMNDPFSDFDTAFQNRIKECDEFYATLQKKMNNDDMRLIQRQALAGMLWSKQFYYFDVAQWLAGDPGQPSPPSERKKGRNHAWTHLNNADILSMPDKWEYPWYAAWDLAFHCIPLAMVDIDFAKHQLTLLTHEWYMHPNGQLPAYEWQFGDVNPPVHAWAAWRVYSVEKMKCGTGDLHFLKSIFHKLLLNFTWWVNRKDSEGNNVFEGGFLGLDNIGVFDRSAELPTGGKLEQADGTSWMAMYAVNMMRIALELARFDKVYEDMATKFFEHFLLIAGAIADTGKGGGDLWDEEDQFFYDVLRAPGIGEMRLKVRSMVGLTPIFAVEILDTQSLHEVPTFAKRLEWFLQHRPDLAKLVSRWQEPGIGEKRLLSLLRGHRLKQLLKRMLDENEFLSDYGIRALSKFHQKNPYVFQSNGKSFTVNYQPGESESEVFGGNSNWRGPIWMPMNYMLIASLYKFHSYYGDDFLVEHPTGSGNYMTLTAIADDLSKRLTRIFLRNDQGQRPIFGDIAKFQKDPFFKDYILFYEYFHGDNGRGVGASHQTGWTGLIAKLLEA
ncbi:glucosidase [bacterium]|nr:glucosidase [bacterium]NUN46178.1 glucosidase [bacterium]